MLLAGLCWMTLTVGAVSALTADARELKADEQGGAEPGTHPSLTASCTGPDTVTLAAIVPVATDHGSYASGIVFDHNRVLTAAHALQGAGHFFVKVGDSFRSADLVMVDHSNDLAVLAVNTALISPLFISAYSPEPVARVWAVGYPRAQAIRTSVGLFQQASDGALYTSAAIDSGQSGGGLLSCSEGSWALVGMLRGYGAYQQGDHFVKLENYSVAVDSHTIKRFLHDFR